MATLPAPKIVIVIDSCDSKIFTQYRHGLKQIISVWSKKLRVD